GRITVNGENDSTEEVKTKNMSVAAGSVPRSLPGLDIDGEQIITSDAILELKEIPKSLIVLGAGAVGVEFASIFRRFGTSVTILELLPRIVPIEDEEISAELAKSFKKQGIKTFTSANFQSAVKEDGGVRVTGRIGDND